MKNRFLLLCGVLSTLTHISATTILSEGDSIRNWTPQWHEQYLADRENPAKWDSIHYNEDLHEQPNPGALPITYGVFPVPQYDLYPGTFDGIIAANFDVYLPSGQRIACVVNGNSKTSLNAPMLGDNDEDFYFVLAVVSDCPQDTVSFDDVNVHGISRNHPDVICEGYVRTSEASKVDFVAFRTANNDAYAIVNMRLFNLNDGSVVFIVPQEDGSLRSMQVKPDELLTFATLREYITSLATEDEAVSKFIATRCDEFCKQSKLP